MKEEIQEKPVEKVEEKPTFEISDAKDTAKALEETPKEEATKEGKEPQTNDSDPKDTGPENKKKPRAQKRIEKLSSEKRDLQKEIDRLNAEKEGKEHQSFNEDVLDPDDFEDYDKYLDALDDQDKKPVKKVEPKSNDNFQKVLDEIEIKFDDARDKYEDFDELITKPLNQGGPALTQSMLETINEFDNSGDIAYALATDVTNSIRIANLTPVKQILELNKLSDKLVKPAEKPGKKVTGAPEPINILGGGEAPRNSLADAANYSDYQKMRSKQNSARNGW